jgi:hypothetical protein
MADVAPNYEERQEFWKPVVNRRSEIEPAAEASEHTCRGCGADLLMGSQFCHVCGAGRRSDFAGSGWRGLPVRINLASIREFFGQSTASLAALILGSSCIIAAVVTGFIFTATTLLDWQAIQLWRIEWLLAAIALLIAGLLLKKR